jgi:hypothetical protein
MNRVTIYELGKTPEIRIEMPINSKILKVDTLFGKTVMWAIVDDSKEKETRYFQIFSTGEEIKPSLFLAKEIGYKMEYIGTFYQGRKIFVYHLFEIVLNKK